MKRIYVITSLVMLLCLASCSQTAEEYTSRGESKAVSEDYNGAIADFSKAIEIDPNNVRSYFGRGLAKAQLADYKGALVDYSKAIEIEPDNAEAYVGRGALRLFFLRNKYEACLDFSKAGDLGSALAYEMIKKHCT